jgi:hypothetical protein
MVILSAPYFILKILVRHALHFSPLLACGLPSNTTLPIGPALNSMLLPREHRRRESAESECDNQSNRNVSDLLLSLSPSAQKSADPLPEHPYAAILAAHRSTAEARCRSSLALLSPRGPACRQC